MKVEDHFSDNVTKKIWHQYFRRVQRLSKPLDPAQQQELILEISDHLFESFNREQGPNEAERLLNAIDKMGDPEEYIKPMVGDRLLFSASRTMNPKTIINSLYYNISGGIKQFLLSLSFSIGYLFAFILVIMSILKIFLPENIGIFISEEGHLLAGVIGGTEVKTDILGYWSIPIGIFTAVVVCLLLTKTLKVIRRPGKG